MQEDIRAGSPGILCERNLGVALRTQGISEQRDLQPGDKPRTPMELLIIAFQEFVKVLIQDLP